MSWTTELCEEQGRMQGLVLGARGHVKAALESRSLNRFNNKGEKK